MALFNQVKLSAVKTQRNLIFPHWLEIVSEDWQKLNSSFFEQFCFSAKKDINYWRELLSVNKLKKRVDLHATHGDYTRRISHFFALGFALASVLALASALGAVLAFASVLAGIAKNERADWEKWNCLKVPKQKTEFSPKREEKSTCRPQHTWLLLFRILQVRCPEGVRFVPC